ncbi:MAG TPA: CHASE3 domain-containing protein [Acidimicrobiales bacterium]|jgi:signal transduction histidine kinase|nr:CHASE3 domain-containing protein [Acidimicrobiales bacterium]
MTTGPGPRRWSPAAGLNQMTLRGRLRAIFAVAVVLLLIALGVSAFSFARLLDGRSTLFDQIDPARLTSEQLLAAFLDQETGVRGYVLTGQASFLQPYTQGRAGQQAASTQLHRLLSDQPELIGLVDQAQQQGRTWQHDFALPALAATRIGNTAFASSASLNRSKLLFDRFRAAMQHLDNALAHAGQEAKDRLNDSTTQLEIVLTAAALAAVLAGLAGQGALRVWVTKPLLSIGGDARQVADGDLGHPIAPTGPPEFRRLAGDSEAMRLGIVGELEEVDRARSELALRNAELGRSNAELEQFAYVASHDLQEPLRKVTSFCQLLQQRYQDQLDDRADQYIEFAVDGAKRMQGLINDLLAFSRAGRTTEQFTPVDLRSCVEAAVRRLDAAIGETGAVITMGALPAVVGDGGLITSVFQNLIGNAIKFRTTATPEVRIDAVRNGSSWLCSVTDNGIGIEPRFADRVFLIFQRLHSREAYAGTGIGLALCRKIIEFHCGTIWLDTNHHPGTRIWFTLPATSGATTP